MSGGRNSFTVNADTSAVTAILDQVAHDITASVIPVSAAGARVLYAEVKRNAEAIGKKSGNLSASIYRVLSKDNTAGSHALYHVSWNHRKAPHGMFLEYGYMQRYKYYVDEKGVVRPLVRPEMQGKKKPTSTGRNRAKLDAYYVLREGGPRHVPGHAFVRRAADKFPEAIEAMKTEVVNQLAARLGGM